MNEKDDTIGPSSSVTLESSSHSAQQQTPDESDQSRQVETYANEITTNIIKDASQVANQNPYETVAHTNESNIPQSSTQRLSKSQITTVNQTQHSMDNGIHDENDFSHEDIQKKMNDVIHDIQSGTTTDINTARKSVVSNHNNDDHTNGTTSHPTTQINSDENRSNINSSLNVNTQPTNESTTMVSPTGQHQPNDDDDDGSDDLIDQFKLQQANRPLNDDDDDDDDLLRQHQVQQVNRPLNNDDDDEDDYFNKKVTTVEDNQRPASVAKQNVLDETTQFGTTSPTRAQSVTSKRSVGATPDETSISGDEKRSGLSPSKLPDDAGNDTDLDNREVANIARRPSRAISPLNRPRSPTPNDSRKMSTNNQVSVDQSQTPMKSMHDDQIQQSPSPSNEGQGENNFESTLPSSSPLRRESVSRHDQEQLQRPTSAMRTNTDEKQAETSSRRPSTSRTNQFVVSDEFARLMKPGEQLEIPTDDPSRERVNSPPPLPLNAQSLLLVNPLVGSTFPENEQNRSRPPSSTNRKSSTASMINNEKVTDESIAPPKSRRESSLSQKASTDADGKPASRRGSQVVEQTPQTSGSRRASISQQQQQHEIPNGVSPVPTSSHETFISELRPPSPKESGAMKSKGHSRTASTASQQPASDKRVSIAQETRIPSRPESVTDEQPSSSRKPSTTIEQPQKPPSRRASFTDEPKQPSRRESFTHEAKSPSRRESFTDEPKLPSRKSSASSEQQISHRRQSFTDAQKPPSRKESTASERQIVQKTESPIPALVQHSIRRESTDDEPRIPSRKGSTDFEKQPASKRASTALQEPISTRRESAFDTLQVPKTSSTGQRVSIADEQKPPSRKQSTSSRQEEPSQRLSVASQQRASSPEENAIENEPIASRKSSTVVETQLPSRRESTYDTQKAGSRKGSTVVDERVPSRTESPVSGEKVSSRRESFTTQEKAPSRRVSNIEQEDKAPSRRVSNIAQEDKAPSRRVSNIAQEDKAPSRRASNIAQEDKVHSRRESQAAQEKAPSRQGSSTSDQYSTHRRQSSFDQKEQKASSKPVSRKTSVVEQQEQVHSRRESQQKASSNGRSPSPRRSSNIVASSSPESLRRHSNAKQGQQPTSTFANKDSRRSSLNIPDTNHQQKRQQSPSTYKETPLSDADDRSQGTSTTQKHGRTPSTVDKEQKSSSTGNEDLRRRSSFRRPSAQETKRGSSHVITDETIITPLIMDPSKNRQQNGKRPSTDSSYDQIPKSKLPPVNSSFSQERTRRSETLANQQILLSDRSATKQLSSSHVTSASEDERGAHWTKRILVPSIHLSDDELSTPREDQPRPQSPNVEQIAERNPLPTPPFTKKTLTNTGKKRSAGEKTDGSKRKDQHRQSRRSTSVDSAAHIRLVDDKSLDSASDNTSDFEPQKRRHIKPRKKDVETNTDQYFDGQQLQRSFFDDQEVSSQKPLKATQPMSKHLHSPRRRGSNKEQSLTTPDTVRDTDTPVVRRSVKQIKDSHQDKDPVHVNVTVVVKKFAGTAKDEASTTTTEAVVGQKSQQYFEPVQRPSEVPALTTENKDESTERRKSTDDQLRASSPQQKQVEHHERHTQSDTEQIITETQKKRRRPKRISRTSQTYECVFRRMEREQQQDIRVTSDTEKNVQTRKSQLRPRKKSPRKHPPVYLSTESFKLEELLPKQFHQSRRTMSKSSSVARSVSPQGGKLLILRPTLPFHHTDAVHVQRVCLQYAIDLIPNENPSSAATSTHRNRSSGPRQAEHTNQLPMISASTSNAHMPTNKSNTKEKSASYKSEDFGHPRKNGGAV